MMGMSRRFRTLQSNCTGVIAGQVWSAWPVLVLLCLSAVLAGCSSLERRARPLPELLQLRQTTEAQVAEGSHVLLDQMVTRLKAQ